MKPKFILVTFAGVLAIPLCAQTPVSPEVSSDRRVTFRLRAPEAHEVRLHCEGVSGSGMTRDDNGIWSITTDPLEPDFYGYSFAVDGLRILDLANPLLKYNLLNTESQVHVPGPSSLPWELNEVPHGAVHRHFYHSDVAGDDRDFLVYTPPSYDPTARKRLPVLYLLHGFSDDPTAWTAVGQANVILDNLIARSQVRPMIVVMPLGYGTMEILRAGGRSRDPDLRARNLRLFRAALLDEVLPRAEKAYRIAAEPQSRAIAGLSMGGAESLTVGLNALDKFSWIGAFSAGGVGTNFNETFPALDEKATARISLLWIGCGKDDGLFAPNKKLEEWLTSQNVRHTWVESPGAHSWRVWRRYLAEFTPLLFQDLKK
jgi:enterochelin esterase-like enzyme